MDVNVLHILEWVSTALSLVGAVLNVLKKRICFPIWIVGNVTWGVWAYVQQIWGLLLVQMVFLIISSYGYYAWNKTDKMEDAK